MTSTHRDDLLNLLAVAKDAALEALERGEPVAWVGGAVPSAHHARLMVACPIVGSARLERRFGPLDPPRWAVRRRSHNLEHEEWFFTPSGRGGGAKLLMMERTLTPTYFWTLQRVQEAVARALGLLDLRQIPEHVQRPISFTPRSRSEDHDRVRARRREQRRANMSPAEKERFDMRTRRPR